MLIESVFSLFLDAGINLLEEAKNSSSVARETKTTETSDTEDVNVCLQDRTVEENR
jgi:hypothetical protein